MKKKILILKNDRVGDLFTSLKLISSLDNKNNTIKLYLSNLNKNFSFLFNNLKIKTINNKINIYDKFKVFFDLLFNKYNKVYILTPKEFYFYLPLFFRKIKFYAIVYNNYKNNRPHTILRKFLYKYKIIYRNKINYMSYSESQNQLLDSDESLDNNYKNINIPNFDIKFFNIIPDNYIFFQFRYNFFDELKWNLSEINSFIKSLNKKYTNVLFCSDIERNERVNFYNSYFEKSFSVIDLNKNLKKINNNSKNIFFIRNLMSKDLLFIIKNSQMCVAKEGIIGHISYFLKKKCHNLYNFKITDYKSYYHQKISYSEWSKGMCFSFSLLNGDVDKAIRKVNKHI